jgi:hypothetical protein
MRQVSIVLSSVGLLLVAGCAIRHQTVSHDPPAVALADSSFQQLCADSLKPTGKGTVGCTLRIQIFQLRLAP